MGAPRFAPGQAIVWRSVWRSDRIVGTAWPAFVVADSPELIALYRPIGTIGQQRSGERGGPRGRVLLHWDGGYGELRWRDMNVLMLHRPGDMHSVWRAWHAATWEVAWRYVNLEEPWTRTAIGFDSKDLYLDLWSERDGTEWHWKDEDEAAWAAENGRITPEVLEAARAEGSRAVARIQRGDPPHDRDWDAWRPDPSWTVPFLPDAWKEYEP